MTAPELISGPEPGPAPTWVPRLTDDGTWTLSHSVLDESCHSSSGAWLEAVERYARPTRLAERAREAGTVRVLDVGTGVGWNLAAALSAVAGAGGRLEVVSLESDASVLAAGRDLPRAGEPGRFLDEVQAALQASHEQGVVERSFDGVSWRLELRLGPAPAALQATSSRWVFDAVLLDPFSPRKSGPAVQGPESPWGADFLGSIARRMLPGALLSTYTASLEVRVALAAAGLSVGPGPRVGPKGSSTLAGREVELGSLDARTERRIASRLRALAAGTAAGDG